MSRTIQTVVTLELPILPSVNAAFASRRGSHLLMKTAAYRAWTRAVQDEHGDGSLLPCLPAGKFGLWLSLPATMRGDIDNRVKLVADVLRAPGGAGNARHSFGLHVTSDDAHMDALYVERGGAPPERVIATVVTLADWPAYLEMRLL